MSSLQSALEEVTGEELDGVPSARLAQDLIELTEHITLVEAERLRRLAEFDRRAGYEESGHVSITSWLRHRCRQAAGAARSLASAARGLRSMKETCRAMAAAEIDFPRVRMLVAAREAHPAAFERDEAVLVDAARRLSVRDLRNVIAYWRQPLDHEEAHSMHRQRALYVSQTLGGMVRIDGGLDPEGGQIVLSALQALTDAANRAPDDHRLPAQRRADALVELSRFFLDHGNTPMTGGEKPHITLTLDLEALEGRAGRRCELDDTGVIHPEAARRLACDAALSRVILQGESEPLDVGRRTRTVPPAMRRALALRDGGCTADGCDLPARWCDAHHLRHWADGGPTSLDNLVLLCRRHHRMEHEDHPP